MVQNKFLISRIGIIVQSNSI